MTQILRQCNFRRNPVAKQNFVPAVQKQKAIRNLRDEIRGYANLSIVAQEVDQHNSSGDIARSYLKKSNKQRNATLDVNRVSMESASIYTS